MSCLAAQHYRFPDCFPDSPPPRTAAMADARRPSGHARILAHSRTAARSAAPPPQTGSQSGFTLIEVLVAMMIMAIMGVMAWQGVDGIVRARDASNERLERQLKLNTVLAQWEQDLTEIQDTLIVDALKFDGSTVRLTRRTPTGMQVVAWTVRGNSWLRWAGPSVTTGGELRDSWQRTLQLLGNETGQLRLSGGVVGWQVYFYRDNAWTNAQSSGDVAGSTDTSTPPTPTPGPSTTGLPSPAGQLAPGRAPGRTALPAAVRMVISFQGDGLIGNLTRDIVLGPQLQ